MDYYRNLHVNVILGRYFTRARAVVLVEPLLGLNYGFRLGDSVSGFLVDEPVVHRRWSLLKL